MKKNEQTSGVNHHSSWKTMILVTFVLTVVGWFSATQQVLAAADSTLLFNPSSSSVTVGADFTLDARVNPGVNHVSAVALRITFDQTKLRLDSITPSSAFPLVLQVASINNTNGTASIDVAVNTTDPSVTAVSSVAVLAFHALATATNSPVTFTSASIVAADGESGNALLTRTPAAVTVVANGSDATPPVRSAGAPTGTLAAGTTETTLSLSTDEFATCKYGMVAGTAYGFIPNTFTVTNGTAHSATIIGLANGTTYNYSVRCEDGSNHVNSDDFTISFSVASASSGSNGSSHHHHKKKKSSSSARTISHSPSTVARGQVLTQRGKKFSKQAPVLVYFSKSNGGYYPPMRVMTSSTGAFILTYRVVKPSGTYSWYVVDTKTGKQSKVKTYRVR